MMRKTISSEFKFTREERVSVPSPASERRMGIRCADWDRLKLQLSQSSHPIPRLHIVYSVIFGIAATAGLSIIPLSMAQGLLPWVIPLYGCVSFFGLVCGVVFVWIDKKVQKQSRSKLSDILEDMKSIENMFKTTEDIA